MFLEVFFPSIFFWKTVRTGKKRRFILLRQKLNDWNMKTQDHLYDIFTFCYILDSPRIFPLSYRDVMWLQFRQCDFELKTLSVQTVSVIWPLSDNIGLTIWFHTSKFKLGCMMSTLNASYFYPVPVTLYCKREARYLWSREKYILHAGESPIPFILNNNAFV